MSPWPALTSAIGTSTKVRDDLMALSPTRPGVVISTFTINQSASCSLLTERALVVVSLRDTQVLQDGDIELGYAIGELGSQ